MPAGDRIIAAHHFLSPLRGFQNVHNILNGFFRKKTIHDRQVKTQRFNIPHKGGIAIDQNRFFEVNRFYKRIAEAFIKAGKGMKSA